jgi:predicted nucleotidyltransferase
MDLPPRVRSAAEDLAARVRRRFGGRVKAVVLFGSFARGDAGPDSDVDVMVLVEGMTPSERGEVFDLAAAVGLDHALAVEAFAPAPEEYAWLVRHERRIVRDIDRDGVAL